MRTENEINEQLKKLCLGLVMTADKEDEYYKINSKIYSKILLILWTLGINVTEELESDV